VMLTKEKIFWIYFGRCILGKDHEWLTLFMYNAYSIRCWRLKRNINSPIFLGFRN
jgi:hypothetical protein